MKAHGCSSRLSPLPEATFCPNLPKLYSVSVHSISTQVARSNVATAHVAADHAAFRGDLAVTILEEIIWYIERLIRGKCSDLHFSLFLGFDTVRDWTATRV